MSITDLLPPGADGLDDLPDGARDVLSNVAEDLDTTTESGDTVHRGRLVWPPEQRFNLGNWRFELLSTADRNFELRERPDDSWTFELDVQTLKLFPDPGRFRPGRLVTKPYYHLQPASGSEVTVTVTDVTVIIDSENGFDLRVGDPDAPGIFEPVTISPRYIMMGETWGMGIGKIIIDLNREDGQNPPQVDALFAEYGITDPDWRGLYMEEVGFYFKNDGGIRLNQVAVQDVAWGFDGDGLTGTGIMELSNVVDVGDPPAVSLELVDDRNHPLHPLGDVFQIEAGTTVRGVATTTHGRAPYHYTWNHPEADTPGGSPSILRISDALTYHREGTFTIEVKVRDFDGRTANASVDIRVSGVVSPPDTLRFALVGHGTADGNSLNLTEDRRAYLEGSVPFTAQFRSFEIEGGTPGYGHQWTIDGANAGSAETLTHTFNTTGSFVVALTITDAVGESTMRRMCVRVFEAPDDILHDLRLDSGRDWLTRPGETRIRVIEGADRADPPPDMPPGPRQLAISVRRFAFPDPSASVCAVAAGSPTEMPPPGYAGSDISLQADGREVLYQVEVTPATRVVRMDDLLTYPPQPNIVLFQLDRDDVYPGDDPQMAERNRQALREMALYLESHTEIRELTLFGDTCDRAPGNYNDGLSQRRADHSLEALEELLSPERQASLTPHATGRGETRIHADGHVPVTGPDAFDEPHDSYDMNEDLRETYRRVQFHVDDDSGPPPDFSELTRFFYVVVSPEAPPPAATEDEERRPGELPEPQRPPFRFDWFKKARLELELFRSEFVRFELSCRIDYKPQLYDPDAPVNPDDGLLDILFALKIHPVTEEYDWTGAVISPSEDPDGIFTIDGAIARYTTAALLLPPIVAARSPASLAEAGVAAAAGAVLGATGVIVVRRLIFRGGRVSFYHKDEGEARHAFLALGIDYALEFDVDVNLGEALRLQTRQSSVIEIKGLGIAFDTDDNWTPTFHFDPQSGMSLDIRDQGLLQAAGPLGNILDVTRAQLGLGSPLWLEAELGLNVNLGVFKVDRFGVRVSYDPDDEDVTVSLTSIGIGVDVPGTFSGSGYLKIVEEGFAGEISLKIIPIDLSVTAAAMIQQLHDFTGVMAAISVEFSPGIPISAAAIYGFSGLFAMHAQRKNGEDALRWYMDNPAGAISVQKWEITQESKDHWAFGVGAVLGDFPVGGSIVNVKGMFMIEIPGPRFLLLMHANILTPRPKTESDATGNIFAVLLLDLEADIFTIALNFNYEIEHILKVNVPVDVFFNLAEGEGSDWHLYVGRDLPIEKRVSLKVFDLWDAWGYLMIDGRGINNLANTGVNLSRVAVATGFRISIEWGAKAINLYLEAYAELHIGLGFRPFMVFGMLEIGGALHVILVSIGARGQVSLLATEDGVLLNGEVCGYLKILWWKVEKCIHFELGELDQPPPDYPFTGLVLRNRFNDEVIIDEEGNPVLSNAPIDCRPTLGFLFGIHGELGAGHAFGLAEITDNPDSREQVSGDLYYHFRLTSLELVKTGGDGPEPTGPFKASWYTSNEREEPKKQTALVLLDWRPQSFVGSVTMEGGFARLVEDFFEGFCDEPEPPGEHCFTFDGQRPGPSDRGWELPHDDVSWTMVVPSATSHHAEEMMADLGLGPLLIEPSVETIPFLPQQYPRMTPKRLCLRLPLLEGTSRPPVRPLTIHTPPMERLCVILALRIFQDVDSLDGGVTFWLSRDPYNPAASPRPHTISLADGELITFLDTPDQKGRWAIMRYCLSSAVVVVEPIVQVDISAGYNADMEARLGDVFADRVPDWNYQYLLEICGVNAEERQAFGRAQANHNDQLDTWNDLVLNGVAPESELLHPSTTYEVRATIDWEAYEQAMGGAVLASGTQNFVQSFTTTSAPPTDLTPYLASIYPARSQESHYTGQPLVVRMATQSVEEIYRRFGRELSINAVSANGISVEEALDLQIEAASQAPDYIVIVQDALQALPCIVDSVQNIFKWAVATLPASFAPNTFYTVTIRAEDTSGAGAAPIDVYSWTFTTSRYANLAEHAAEYEQRQFDLLLDPLDPATRATIRASLPTGMSSGERRLEEIMVSDLHSEPMEPSPYPVVYRLWADDNAGSWEFLGLLLDGPEPLLKRDSDGAITTLSIRDPDDGSDISFRGLQGERGARALLWLDRETPRPMEINLHMQVPVILEEGEAPLIEEDAAIAVRLAALPDMMMEREN